MSTRPEDDNDEVYFSGDNEDNTPVTCATQTLDLLALHLPPEKLIPQLVWLKIFVTIFCFAKYI